MILLFVELYPRVYIEEFLINKLQVDVKKIMPASFTLFDDEPKQEIKMPSSLMGKLSEPFRKKLLTSDGSSTVLKELSTLQLKAIRCFLPLFE
jgi:hypothetical protein